MEQIKKTTRLIILLAIVLVFSFLIFYKKDNNLENPSGSFSEYYGYLTKINDHIIFRNCQGDKSYHVLVPTNNVNHEMIIDKPTFVKVMAKISNTISEVDQIQISREKTCEGNTSHSYLLNIFTALRKVSEDETLTEDGKNFKSSESQVPDCSECLLYVYEFDHYSEPGLHYKTQFLIKNGTIIKEENSN